MKFLLYFFITLTFSYSTEIVVSDVNIQYDSYIDIEHLAIVNTTKKVRCRAFDVSKLHTKTYVSKRYIIKGHPICERDVKVAVKNRIRYDFGSIVIERNGKVIGENRKFIKIKNNDGSIEKIYKNGQSR